MEQAVTAQPQTREQVVAYAERELANPNLDHLEIHLPYEFNGQLDGELEHTLKVVAREKKFTLKHDAGYVLLSRT